VARPAEANPLTAAAAAQPAQTLLDGLPDAVWMKDTKGRLVAVNRTFSQRYGIAQAAAPGKTEFDFLPRDRASRMLREDSALISAGKPLRYESAEELDGRPGWIEIVKSPVTDADGRVTGMIGTARDIASRKAAEKMNELIEDHPNDPAYANALVRNSAETIEKIAINCVMAGCRPEYVPFVIAAVVTPPDVVSQLALAIPMCLLYELGIWAAQIFIKHTQAPDEEAAV
jgi:PAS domain S-box-containing protein